MNASVPGHFILKKNKKKRIFKETLISDCPGYINFIFRNFQQDLFFFYKTTKLYHLTQECNIKNAATFRYTLQKYIRLFKVLFIDRTYNFDSNKPNVERIHSKQE